MDFINRLREKPASTKKQIAVAASALVTLVIFGLWMTVFNFGFNQKSANNTAAVANAGDANTDVNPLVGFWSVLSKGWDGLSNNVNKINAGVEGAKNFVSTLSGTTSAGVESAPSAQAGTQPASNVSQKDVFILNN